MIDTPAMANVLEAAGMERRQAEALTDHLNPSLRASVEHRLDRVDSRLETIDQRLIRIEAELPFHRWAFTIVIGLQIALLLRAFWPA